jgi:serine/threonine protein kinase
MIKNIKICDFGFALEVDVTKRMISQISECSIRFGTKQYQPPETTIQNGAFPFTFENIYKVDIWSLGVILFIMLSVSLKVIFNLLLFFEFDN